MNTGIQIEGGWSVDSNIFISKDFDLQEIPFDNTLLFSAVNHIIGKSISISYENEEVGYSLDYCILPRYLGKWQYNEENNIYKTLKVDHDLNVIYNMLQEYLNPIKKNLIPLKISSWRIIYNNFINENDIYNDIEFVFSATRGKLFIDVVYYKNTDKPYYIYMGISKYKYTELTYNIDKPVQEYKEIYLENIEDVTELINNFLVGFDDFFYKLYNAPS